MKLKNVVCGLMVLFGVTFTGCDKEDLEGVPVMIQDAFYSEYPNSDIYDCDMEGMYWVVETKIDGKEADVWFDTKGTWVMTEYDIRYKDLPQSVRTSFEHSKYAGWQVDDQDKVERPDLNNPDGKAITYVIEVEMGEIEYNLHYTPEGILTKEEPDMDGGNMPYIPQTSVPAEISSFISQTYGEDARIIEYEREINGDYDVDIIDEGIAKEVVFTSTFDWKSTSWDVMLAQVPAAVTTYVKTTYPGYIIDDADWYETPQGNYYVLELEQGMQEIHLKINADGTSPEVLPYR